MGYKSEATKEALNKIKENKGTEMKTSNKKTVVVTVVATLVVLAAFAAQALFFYNLGNNDRKNHETIVMSEAKELAQSLKPSQK